MNGLRPFLLSALWLGLVATLPLFAQPQIRVCGQVFDRQTTEPLPGASVLFGADRGISTDEDGGFCLSLPRDVGRITVRYLGYRTQVVPVDTHLSDSLFLLIYLDQELREMDQVVISASRSARRLAEATVSLTVIRPDALPTGAPADMQEMLARVPGLEVLDGQAAIRGGSGFSYGAGSRVLTLVDGMPALSADAGSIRWYSLPLENIGQIEVIKGAASVLYGSSALNGIIHFRTARADTLGRTRIQAESGIYGTPGRSEWKWWEGHQHFSSVSVSHLKRYGNTDVALGGFALKDDGYRRLNDEQFLRLNMRLEHQNRHISGLYYGLGMLGGLSDKRDFLLWEDAQKGALKQNPETASRLDGKFIYLDPFVGFSREGIDSHLWQMRLHGHDNRYPQTIQNNASSRLMFSEYQYSRELKRSMQFIGGVVYQLSDIRSHFYGDHRATNMAAYGQWETRITRGFGLQAGMRLENNALNGRADSWVPLFRAGINMALAPMTALRASFGQGYRYPAIAEKYATTRMGAIQIFANPELEPESGWNAEIGIKQGVLGPVWNGLFDIAVFYTRNKNLIEFLFGIYPDLQGDYGFGFRADNTEYSRVYGLELESRFAARLGRTDLNIDGGYVYMHPVAFNPYTGQNTGDWLKYRRKHMGQLQASLAYGKFVGGITALYRSRMLRIDEVFLNEETREGILPGFFDYWSEHNSGYMMFDLLFSYRFSPAYSLAVIMRNAGNAEYMGRPGDIRPPRQFSLRLSADF